MTESKGSPGRSRARSTASVLLVVIASLLVPASCLTVWVRNVVLDVDDYVETVAPLARQPEVRAALAARVTAAVSEALDLEQRAQDALPRRARFLAPAIAAGGEQLVGTVATQLVDSEAFPTVWDQLNRAAHRQVVAALTGRGDSALEVEDGQVVLNLRPLAQQLASRLAEVAPGVPADIDLSRVDARYVLIESEQLADVQGYARLLDKLAWLVPALALVLGTAAIAVAARRRGAVVMVGLGIAISMMLTLVAYGLGRTAYLDALPATANQAAAALTFDTLTRFFERALRAVLVVGLLVALIAWLTGTSRAAETVRRQWHRLGSRGAEADEPPSPVSVWVARHAMGLRAGLLVTLALVLLTWTRPTGAVIVGLTFLGLVGLGAIQFVGAGAGRTSQEAAPDSW